MVNKSKDVVDYNDTEVINYMKTKKKKRVLFLVLLFTVSISFITVGVILEFSKKTDTEVPVKEKKEDTRFGFSVNNDFTELGVNEQIALLLVSDYMKERSFKENLEKAEYVDNVFELSYVLKYGSDNNNDVLQIKTGDFIKYNITVTKYENGNLVYDTEEDYDEFMYQTLDLVYKLVNDNGYSMGDRLAEEKMMDILEVLKKTDVGTYVNKALENGYILKSYKSVSKYKLVYIFKSKMFGYLEISTFSSNGDNWNVYGYDIDKLSSKYKYESSRDDYVIDIQVNISDKDHEAIKSIMGDFLDNN